MLQGPAPGGAAIAPVADALLAAVVESSDDAIVTYGLDGTVTSWNRAAERLHGYPAEEMVGTPHARIVPDDRRAEATAVLAEVARGGRVEHTETVRLHRSGARIDVSLTASPVHAADGRVAAVSTITRDIGERLRLERERAAAAAELERRNRELTAANAELERANRDLEEFAYVASHDLSEPLRSIAGFLQLLERRYADGLDDRARDYIARAVGGAGRMQTLIEDLLRYSRAGRSELELEPVDTRALAEEVLDSLGAAVEEARAEIELGELPAVVADRRQVGQVLQNLVGNALKFRGDAPARVRVSAERAEGAWAFEVADRGIGVEERHAERIFLIFKRLHQRSAYAGTGIGLALCRAIVERHGGSIGVRPRPGGGSVFRFTIPDRGPDAAG